MRTESEWRYNGRDRDRDREVMLPFCRGHKILFQKRQDRQAEKRLSPPPHLEGGGEGILPYMGYFGMCSAKGYGFSAALVINRVSILAILPPLWL